jgi:serine O-acetyltransferase
MNFEISKEEIIGNLIKQLESFFTVSTEEVEILRSVSEKTFERCSYCFSKNPNKYYSRKGEVYFNPYHTGQYTIFLYYYSNSIFKSYTNEYSLADKVYYLNKIMNSCDLYYEIDLPEIFILDHPVGSVIGRAKFGNYFTFGQNCTVGNNRGIFPIIGENVRMAANSMILGNSHIGDNVIIGAGSCVKDQNVPANSIAFGTSPNLIFKTRKN